MIKTYFKIAWRNLIRRKFYSSLNIFGLAVALAFTLLTTAYIWGELQVNKNLNNISQQYLLQSTWKGHETNEGTRTPAAAAKMLKDLYPGLVQNYYRSDWVSSIVSVGDRYFRDSLQKGDSTLISMYGFPVLHGDKNSAFNNPDAVVITESKAIKFFGKTDVVGKALTIENYTGQRKNFIVTAVLKDLPYNTVTVSTVPGNVAANSTFLPIEGIRFFYPDVKDVNSWYNSMTSFIELKQGVQSKDLVKPIEQLIALYAPADIKSSLKIHLTPLASYHLDSNTGINRKMVYTLSFIGLFILLMAIVNFVNLSISNATFRLKEMGVRKVMGSMRKNIIWQLLIESFMIVFIAVVFAVLLYQLLRPLASGIVGREIPSLLSFPLYYAWVPCVLVFVIGILAGIYPAKLLASLTSVESLKGKLKSIKDNILLRRALIGLQFSITIIVFTAAIIVTTQVSYFLNDDLGFNKEQIINVALPRNWTASGVANMETVRNQMASVPGVTDASLCYSIPNRNVITNSEIYRQGQDSSNAITAFTFITDEHFASTYQIPLAAGAFFSSNEKRHAVQNIILNEAAVKALGWKNVSEAVGNKIELWGAPANICGIVKDYHFESKREIIKPLMIMHVENFNAYRFISCKIKAGAVNATIDKIHNKFAELIPAAPFEYAFLDETVNKAYQSEIRLKKATYTATGLALIIVLLGIVGMVSASVAKRTKEIGVRKVLGASVNSIVALFTKEIIMVMSGACIIACPVAYIIMKGWINDYAYRISIGIYPFIIVVFVLAALTCLLICIQTIKVALANPVKSLRTE
ncbi:ABC transporter permease [Chitinophagaceae bacterium LWZ2-11]